MNITVAVPSALRRFTLGTSSVECQAATLDQLWHNVGEQFPALLQHLQDENGAIRRFINVYVNDEDVRFLGGNSYQFREGDQVLLVPSIAGG